MQCYTELVPPNGVTHALTVPFISAAAKNLVLARTSLLQIFSLHTIAPIPGDPNARPGQLGQDTTKLVLEREYSLPGTITDLCRVKTLNTKSGGEAILLSFRDAKLSLIEWDSERYGISTISIHYYERDDLARSPWVSDLSSCGSILTADPSSRCAVFHFGTRNLAIIPFHQPGDDLVMDDYGSDLAQGEEIGDGSKDRVGTAKTNDSTAHSTPYAPSFVLPLTALDPSILHPISLGFLYEYREPTFGILYSQVATSNSLLHERKDVVFYTVFTLDLEQRASTTLLSVTRLPSDLFKVIALPPPVGGSLLIGSNELVHVDQAGKTNAVGVNEFSRQVSSFSMTDQSDLGLRLENCVVERISENTGDLLLALSTGDMVIVSFKLDGRSVSGVLVQPLPPHVGGSFMTSGPSSSAFLGNGRVFFGSEDADSVLLEWSYSSLGTKKTRTQQKPNTNAFGDFSDGNQSDDDAYEDDLYSTAPETTANGRHPSVTSSLLRLGNLQIHDRLLSSGPLRDIALGRTSATFINGAKDINDIPSNLELVASQGSDRSGGLVVMKREIDPCVVGTREIEPAETLWTASVVQPTSEQSEDRSSRNYVIVSRRKDVDKEESEVFVGEQLEPFKAPEFNPNEDITIEIGTLADGHRVVQVLKNEVRSYDTDLGLIQIYPIWDDESSDERVAISANLMDTYVAIIRDDLTLLLLQADESGDLDEVKVADEIITKKWLSSCLYCDKTGLFTSFDSTPSGSPSGDIFLCLLSQDSKLYMYRLPDHRLISIIDSVDCLLPILSAEPPKRSNMRENLIEAVVVDLGDSQSNLPYLILRTENDDLITYRPFVTNGSGKERPALKFFKETNHVMSTVPTDATKNMPSESKPLRILPNISGSSTIFMPGGSAGFIFRTATNPPHFVRLKGNYSGGLGDFDSPKCEEGFVFLDSKGIVHVCRLPGGTQLGHPWISHRVHIGEQIDHLAYSPASETYILGTCHKSEFKLPDDDELHPEWRNEVVSFLPEVHSSSLKVVSPKTWSVIDSYSLGPAEHIMAIKSMSLEVSENTHERRDMIVVGTALARGEDVPSRGCVYVFEVIKVVNDPERPETDRKLKLIGKELVKGAVTALSEIGGQGFLLVVQGQKCLVRGLKEDGSLLPVAFMDMQCYVSVVKELKGTGMCILGDAVKGLWFAGYSEEPYKMSLFAKDLDYLEVLAADFLPDGNRLYVLVADSDCNLHVLQYDPEDPRSSNGDRLLSRSKFHTGNFPSTIILLPRTMVSSELTMFNSEDDMDLDNGAPLYQALITSQNGSIGLVTCVPEESYRRLSALQSQLTNTIEHPCGLNPRAFRAVESDGTAGRGMLDGNLLFQWLDMSKQRKVEIAGRVGANEWEIRADLEIVGGDGLGYL